MTESRMTKGERDELIRLLKARERVAKRGVEQRAAELLADAEQQLAMRYKIDADAWRDLTRTAQEGIKDVDAELAERCRKLGIPEEFRPRLELYWYGRGENALKERRAELRKVAQTRIDALAEKARHEIETNAVEGLTKLVAGGLESAAAREFLETMPTPAMLMPAVDVATLGPLALPQPQKDEEAGL